MASARSPGRWSQRSTASTMVAIFPADRARHRDPIFFRWPRIRSASQFGVALDSGRRAVQTRPSGPSTAWLFFFTPNSTPAGGTAVGLDGRPGRTSEITACRHDQLTAKLRADRTRSHRRPGLRRPRRQLSRHRPGSDHRLRGRREPTPDLRPEAVEHRASSGPGTGGAWPRPPQELARARQGTHRPRLGDRPGPSLVGPHEPRSLPVTDDLHRSHLQATSTNTPMPTHTRPVTSNFSLHTLTGCARPA